MPRHDLANITGHFDQVPQLKPRNPFLADNRHRNVALAKQGLTPPKVTSTGTTIVACIFDKGIVMGADSRATGGNIIADKNCLKVHKLTDTIYACGAGTAADLDQVCNMLSAQLKLHQLSTGRKARVATACRRARQHLIRYMGYVGAYLLIGGVDDTGCYLYDVSASGCAYMHQFAADGSGSYAAVTVLERGFHNGIQEKEATALVCKALEAGMHADNMSGNSYNYTIITNEGANFHGPCVPAFAQPPEPRELSYAFKKGSTQVLKERKFPFETVAEEKMETD